MANGRRVHCPELTGRDERGNPLRECHQHAHIWPVDLDSDGKIDHFIVYAGMGLGQAAQQAIRNVRSVWTKKGTNDLQLALAGMGDLDVFRGLPDPLGRRIRQLLGPTEGARLWESITPFVPPRFLKRRGANTLLGQINAELASRGISPAEQVDPLPHTPESLRLRHYIRARRQGGGPPPIDVGYGLRLTFPEPVRGPIALGYASHYGLGLFAAINE